MKKRVLIIEDDEAIGRLLIDNLQYEGFVVGWSKTGRDAQRLVKRFAPDLVLLDLMLPGRVDGFEICRTFSQAAERMPIIIITARGEKEDRVRGLMLGADDYVTKPFALDELLARVHAVLRRTRPRLDKLTLGNIAIDFRGLRATAGTSELLLTDREFEVLRYLAERAGTLVSRDELLRRIWGYSDATTTRTVDNFIFRLRQKIEPDPHHPRYIRTAYGDGYRFTFDTDAGKDEGV